MDNAYLILLNLVLGIVLGTAIGAMLATRRGAYDRGLAYALTALFRSTDDEATVLRLVSEAGDAFEHDPFDDAIMDVLLWFNDRREVRVNAMWEVIDALNDMKLKGEASTEEVDTALDVVARLLSENQEEPEVFCVEHLAKRDGEAYLGRRPLRDWPSWAQELRESIHGPA